MRRTARERKSRKAGDSRYKTTGIITRSKNKIMQSIRDQRGGDHLSANEMKRLQGDRERHGRKCHIFTFPRSVDRKQIFQYFNSKFWDEKSKQELLSDCFSYVEANTGHIAFVLHLTCQKSARSITRSMEKDLKFKPLTMESEDFRIVRGAHQSDTSISWHKQSESSVKGFVKPNRNILDTGKPDAMLNAQLTADLTNFSAMELVQMGKIYPLNFEKVNKFQSWINSSVDDMRMKMMLSDIKKIWPYDIFKKCRHLWITGDEGSGKTALVKWLIEVKKIRVWAMGNTIESSLDYAGELVIWIDEFSGGGTWTAQNLNRLADGLGVSIKHSSLKLPRTPFVIVTSNYKMCELFQDAKSQRIIRQRYNEFDIEEARHLFKTTFEETLLGHNQYLLNLGFKPEGQNTLDEMDESSRGTKGGNSPVKDCGFEVTKGVNVLPAPFGEETRKDVTLPWKGCESGLSTATKAPQKHLLHVIESGESEGELSPKQSMAKHEGIRIAFETLAHMEVHDVDSFIMGLGTNCISICIDKILGSTNEGYLSYYLRKTFEQRWKNLKRIEINKGSESIEITMFFAKTSMTMKPWTPEYRVDQIANGMKDIVSTSKDAPEIHKTLKAWLLAVITLSFKEPSYGKDIGRTLDERSNLYPFAVGRNTRRGMILSEPKLDKRIQFEDQLE